MLFFSIIGGEIFSTAWDELRRESHKTVNRPMQPTANAAD